MKIPIEKINWPDKERQVNIAEFGLLNLFLPSYVWIFNLIIIHVHLL